MAKLPEVSDVAKPRSNRQLAVERPSVVKKRKVSLRAITTGSDEIDKVLNN
eukprot:COSAG02_NODE_7679_length_2897_cov_1.815225_1_plen_51_part_00